METYKYRGEEYEIDGEWLKDSRGNKNSSKYHGSIYGAVSALFNLRSCDNCTNCSYCYNCSDCYRCSDCTSCSGDTGVVGSQATSVTKRKPSAE